MRIQTVDSMAEAQRFRYWIDLISDLSEDEDVD